jgi:hypothetical protein
LTRKRFYPWKRINAVAEATSHDNSKSDGDQVEAVADDIAYAERKGISLADAIMWANSLPGDVTLYEAAPQRDAEYTRQSTARL